MSFNKNRESSRHYLKTIFKKFPNFNGFMINKFYFKINNDTFVLVVAMFFLAGNFITKQLYRFQSLKWSQMKEM